MLILNKWNKGLLILVLLARYSSLISEMFIDLVTYFLPGKATGFSLSLKSVSLKLVQRSPIPKANCLKNKILKLIFASQHSRRKWGRGRGARTREKMGDWGIDPIFSWVLASFRLLRLRLLCRLLFEQRSLN